MIVEEEKHDCKLQLHNYLELARAFKTPPFKTPNIFAQYMNRVMEIRDSEAHMDLHRELMEHYHHFVGNSRVLRKLLLCIYFKCWTLY